MDKLDTFRDQGLRRQMVLQLKELGIKDAQVLEAINRVPRHWFLDTALIEYAYQNMALQIGSGQTISQPFTVAYQTQLLQIKKGDKILEIGTGSGYQTSVLAEMGAKIYSIERQKLLFDKTKLILKEMGYKLNLYYGDGYKGKEVFAPYDGVIVTCGAPFVPEALLNQLKIGGRLIIPLGEGKTQTMTEILKKSPTDFTKKTHGEYSFVPMLESREKRIV